MADWTPINKSNRYDAEKEFEKNGDINRHRELSEEAGIEKFLIKSIQKHVFEGQKQIN